jgi:hypothetical protein
MVIAINVLSMQRMIVAANSMNGEDFVMKTRYVFAVGESYLALLKDSPALL